MKRNILSSLNIIAAPSRNDMQELRAAPSSALSLTSRGLRPYSYFVFVIVFPSNQIQSNPYCSVFHAPSTSWWRHHCSRYRTYWRGRRQWRNWSKYWSTTIRTGRPLFSRHQCAPKSPWPGCLPSVRPDAEKFCGRDTVFLRWRILLR